MFKKKALSILRQKDGAPDPASYSLDDDYGLYHEHFFNEMVVWERKRTERSRRPFVLVLLDIHRLYRDGFDEEIIKTLSRTLSVFTRDVDAKGWYSYKRVIGIVCPDVDREKIAIVKEKVRECLRRSLPETVDQKVRISCIPFPEADITTTSGTLGDMHTVIYPELNNLTTGQKVSYAFKRFLDIMVAGTAIVMLSPFFLIVPLIIRLTSPGPVFFRQKRVGYGGKAFTFLKFRSMRVDAGTAIHQEYIKRFIKNENSQVDSETRKFKMTDDPRVTAVGRFIRKTSIDELPQLINVLRGDMSLVGPRPPIPYEVAEYDLWHKRRIMEVKPGITGIWQVKGRSRTTFDTMVRMDIEYIENWSLWLDVVLLVKTPMAIFNTKGAY